MSSIKQKPWNIHSHKWNGIFPKVYPSVRKRENQGFFYLFIYYLECKTVQINFRRYLIQNMFSDHNGIIIRNRQNAKHSAHTGNQKRFGNLKTFFKYL